MLLSDLQDKDVIDISTGLKIGNIIDIKVNEDGLIESLMLEKKKYNRIIFSNDNFEIKWDKIVKIGEDVILVKSLNNK
jgi:YlmC/YmxH family sporulation protein